MNLNLLLHCLLWPQIAKNKVLGLLQPLEARELGESIVDLMPTPDGVSHVSVYQISEQQFSRALIGSRNSEYPWLLTVLLPEPRWRLVSRFSEDEICTINDRSSRTNKYQESDERLGMCTTIHLPLGG